MKITGCFLLVAISCFFTPATSNCIRKCVKSCESRSNADLSCMQVALASNLPATVNAMAHFLCSYDRCKNMNNKRELLRALTNLMDVTGCPSGNLLGTGTTVEDLLMDVDGTLEPLLRTVVQLLSSLDLGSLNTPLCGLLGPLLTKISRVLLLFSGQNLGGVKYATGNRYGETGGLIRGKQIAGALPERTPGLLGGVIDTVGSLTGGTQGGIGGLLRHVTEGVGDLVNGLTGVDGITAGLGGVTGILRGLTGGNGGSGRIVGDVTGGLGENTQGLRGLTWEDKAGANRGATGTANRDIFDTDVSGEITGRGTLGLSSGLTDGFLGNGGLPQKSVIFSSDLSTDFNSAGRLPTRGLPQAANGGFFSGTLLGK